MTQVAYEDAEAYAKWAGGRIPTEAEWERAARGRAKADRDEQLSSPSPQTANTWQGVFPVSNSAADGFTGVAPVGCFPPNDLGLYDTIGNVWEWTQDVYAPGHADLDPLDPQGPPPQMSRDPNNRGGLSRVVKGGSFLCAENYCRRYRAATRLQPPTDTERFHHGRPRHFRFADPNARRAGRAADSLLRSDRRLRAAARSTRRAAAAFLR